MADESGNVRTQTIDRATYERLCEALPDAERWLCVLAYHTGWRLGKLLSLTWAQVDWEEMVLRAPAHQRESKRVGTAPIYGDMQPVLREALAGGAATVIHRPGRLACSGHPQGVGTQHSSCGLPWSAVPRPCAHVRQATWPT